jgi:hypothetical protein
VDIKVIRKHLEKLLQPFKENVSRRLGEHIGCIIQA